jgi:putative MATE family efflux protein
MKAQNTNLAQDSVGKLLLKLALPAITSQIVNMLYNIVDRIYIGHIPGIGTQALTGVGVCLPLIMVISAFASLASMGGAPRASIAMGRGNKEESERIMGNCFGILLILSVILTIVFTIYSRDLLLLFGASENTIEYSVSYMQIYAIGTLFVQVALGMNAFITAQGFATMSMVTVLIGAILNTILDPIFIFGFGMGVKGAALATIISQAVSAIWVVSFLISKKTGWKLQLKHMKLQPKVFIPCLALGLSPFIMQSTESLIAISFNSSLLKYGGDIAVGSMTVVGSIMQFCMLPLQGLTQGAQPIISYNYGAKNADRVKKAFKILLRCCLMYSFTLWILIMLLPKLFIGIFTPDVELMDYAVKVVRIYMAASGIFGIQIACQQTFIALGNAKASLFLAILRKIILLIPLIFILPLFFHDKVSAVFLAEPIADALAVTATSILFSIQFKKIMKSI